MARWPTLILVTYLVFTACYVGAAEAPGRNKLVTGVDVSYVDASGYASWAEGSVGKLRYDDNNDGLVISRAFADYQFHASDTFKLRAAVQAYDDDLGSAVDFTETYLEWRPVPHSENRYRLKVGAFYPRVSFENTGPGWSSPYTLNSSAINTWVAEELRTVGAELSMSRRPAMLGGAHTVSIHSAIFVGNDPTGSLLAWKGWSVHDRQSRFGDELPLPPLPQIQPGMMFEVQDPYVVPFREVDDRVGYYVNGEWQFGQRLRVRAMHYDNRAEPTALDGGQYAWTTKFEHLGAHLALADGWELLFQWMIGSTVMGPVMNGAHVVDTEFDARYLMLTKGLDRHRVSARFDKFEVMQNDQTPDDDNSDDGHAWTIAYLYDYSDNMSFAVESLTIKTHHPGWQQQGLDPVQSEKQYQLTVQLRFGN